MTLRTKSSVKANFETNDKPTQAEFADWIDSTVFIPTTGGTGIVEVEGTVSATMRALGAFGVHMIGAATTASAQTARGLLTMSRRNQRTIPRWVAARNSTNACSGTAVVAST